MTERKLKAVRPRLEALVAQDRDLLKALVKEALDQILQAEMTEFLGAAPGERNATRAGYRAGYYERGLVTRVGQDRAADPARPVGRVLDVAVRALPAQREGAGVGLGGDVRARGVDAQGEGDHRGVVRAQLCRLDHQRDQQGLDEGLTKFAQRRLTEEYPYLIVDARYEKVRDDGIIQSQAVLMAIGINWEGQRQVLGVELANRESQTSWREFLLGLKQRGLRGVELAVSDDHAGLRKAIAEVLPEAAWQRCYVHFLRNALDYLPRKGDDDCLQELRWLYARRNVAEAQHDLAAWLARWQRKYPKLTDWVEENIGSTLTFYRLPRQHHKHLKSTNMLERLNEELRRRTRVVRIFPNAASCMRLIRALCVETHEGWLEDHRYLNMDLLREARKDQLRKAA